MKHAARHVPFVSMACLLIGTICPSAMAVPPEATVLTGRTMGTTYRLKYWGDGKASSREMHDAVDRLLADVDRQMSTYRDDSELSRFNLAPADQWFGVSKATADVVAQATELHRRTGGAYDVTVAPALRLWGFGPGAQRDRPSNPPSAEQLDAIRQIAGSHLLEVRREPPALRKRVAGVEVDLSSIAPGYAVDLIVELLAKADFKNSIVEIGGEVRAAGVNADGTPWRVGVEQPAAEPPKLAQAICLRDLALSTSGDYRNFQILDGQRFAHVLDARNLRPLPSRGMSVTVLAPTCSEADALGTALLIMGPEAGRQWCIEHQVAALFQYRVDGDRVSKTPARIERVTTPRFDNLASPQDDGATQNAR